MPTTMYKVQSNAQIQIQIVHLISFHRPLYWIIVLLPVVTWGSGAFVVVITGEGVGLPDAEQSSAPSIVTFSTLGKVENSNVRLTFNLFSADCWALNSLFSKEQMFPEHCTFETAPDVKLVTGEENVISIFQNETGFGNVT